MMHHCPEISLKPFEVLQLTSNKPPAGGEPTFKTNGDLCNPDQHLLHLSSGAAVCSGCICIYPKTTYQGNIITTEAYEMPCFTLESPQDKRVLYNLPWLLHCPPTTNVHGTLENMDHFYILETLLMKADISTGIHPYSQCIRITLGQL